MNALILRAATRILSALMLLFSLFVLLRGHDAPGGGFIGGLLAAIGFVLAAIAEGPVPVRHSLRADPRVVAVTGLALALGSGAAALLVEAEFLTGLWGTVLGLTVGTPLLFDVGVYLVVVGTVTGVLLGMEEEREER